MYHRMPHCVLREISIKYVHFLCHQPVTEYECRNFVLCGGEFLKHTTIASIRVLPDLSSTSHLSARHDYITIPEKNTSALIFTQINLEKKKET